MTIHYTPATLPENLKHRDTNQLTYVPSDAGVTTRYRYNIRWWGEGAFFQYPSLLVSAFNGMKYWDFRERYEIPRKNFLFIADSGGYQVFSKEAYLDPIDVLRWMENNADIGMMLDRPPTFEVASALTDKFKKCADKNLEQFNLMNKNRQDSEMKLFKPIHGSTLETLDYWFNKVKEVPCDGYASSPRRATAGMAAFTLGFAIEHGLHNFHLFLGSGWNVMPVIIYATKYIKNLTFDSSSFSLTGARYKKYVVPLGYNEYIPFGRDFKVLLDELPCSCPVCTKISHPLDLQKSDATAAGLILLHNLYMTLDNIELLRRLLKDEERFKNVIRKNYPPDTVKGIEYLDAVHETGIDDAFKVFEISLADLTGSESLSLHLPQDLSYWTNYRGNFDKKRRGDFVRGVLREAYKQDKDFKDKSDITIKDDKKTDLGGFY